ncbi:uncharacterized protein K444DRAFT_360587 [Hyaloscypha bicolor E]|uniref:Uncharacterized protein n=1 Tax=Hyaloscypha bicolor E TaxID=1095630 RepID=A0A2J6TG54_9HELO|nr:uncharacterized protein K444DRAFT_360587 [Hyaloscypha bicolor E]PMD62005.1 hypothetical protein K444DRAFT_360587 [Hyaloscypha bicolor E]
MYQCPLVCMRNRWGVRVDHPIMCFLDSANSLLKRCQCTGNTSHPLPHHNSRPTNLLAFPPTQNTQRQRTPHRTQSFLDTMQVFKWTINRSSTSLALYEKDTVGTQQLFCKLAFLSGVCPQLLCLGWRSHRNCGQRVFTFCSLILGRQGANHLAQSRDFNISDASTDTTTTAVIAGAAITDGGLGSVLLSILSAEASAFSPTQVSSTAPPSVERIPGPPTSTPSTASNPVSSTSSTSTGTPSSPLSSPVVSASTTMTSMNFTSPVSTSIAPLNSDKHNTIP